MTPQQTGLKSRLDSLSKSFNRASQAPVDAAQMMTNFAALAVGFGAFVFGHPAFAMTLWTSLSAANVGLAGYRSVKLSKPKTDGINSDLNGLSGALGFLTPDSMDPDAVRGDITRMQDGVTNHFNTARANAARNTAINAGILGAVLLAPALIPAGAGTALALMAGLGVAAYYNFHTGAQRLRDHAAFLSPLIALGQKGGVIPVRSHP